MGSWLEQSWPGGHDVFRLQASGIGHKPFTMFRFQGPSLEPRVAWRRVIKRSRTFVVQTMGSSSCMHPLREQQSLQCLHLRFLDSFVLNTE